MTHLTEILAFPRKNTPASQPVERIQNGTRVAVLIAIEGFADHALPGVVTGVTLALTTFYTVALEQKPLVMTQVPEDRIRRIES